MRYVVDAASMKAVDEYSIKQVGIPSLVLMERAALCVTETILEKVCHDTDSRILCVCGTGNNGADGLAVARQLTEKNINTDVYTVGEGNTTSEYRVQLNIIENLGIECISKPLFDEYDVIVDAVFGNGLSRNVEGRYKDIVDLINGASKKGCTVVAVDIPTGVNATDGRIMGCCVNADITVTFGYEKLGMILYPGTAYCGEVIIKNIGFAPYYEELKEIFVYEDEDIKRLPERQSDGNKGTYGKALVVAGSSGCGGAAILAGKAAYNMGTGLVKVLTHIDNKEPLLIHVPECLISTYDDTCSGENASQLLEESFHWATCIAIGPGLSTDKRAERLTLEVAKKADMVRVFDADALNIIARNKITIESCGKESNAIITPHIGEMSRLTGISVPEIKKNIIATAVEYAREYHVICVLKDARTVVTDGERVYINCSGNDGMATGGSGDVLTGIITGLLATGMGCFDAACLGTFIHGKAGDKAAECCGNVSMTATDIARFIKEVIK